MRLIDADKLKEGLRGNFKEVMGNFVFNTTFAELEAIIDTAPTVKVLSKRPQGEWIPVSEKLPDKEGEYLVTRADFDNWGICRLSNVIDIAKFDCISRHNNGFHKAYEVIAWMPLPLPYEEDNENE